MARSPQTIERRAQLNPVASPVDTFVQAGRSPLADLAESLSKVDPALQGFMSARKEKQDEEDRIRGEAAFYSEHEGELAEAVRTGVLPSQYSPAFVRGFKSAQGQTAGGALREKFSRAFDAWDGKNSDDPAAFDGFLQDFLKENVQSKDPHVLAGLLPSVREIQANGRARYIEYRHQQTYNGSLDANTAAALQDVDRGNEEGLASETGTNYEAVFASIEEKRAAFIQGGGNPEDFDKSMMAAMSAKIMELQDPGLLKWFDRKIPGTDRAYKDLPDGLKIKNATLDQLEAEARRQLSDDAQRQTAERTRLKEEAVSGIIQSILDDPAAPVPEELLKQAERNGDETIRTKISGWRKDLATGVSDPVALKAVTEDIITDPSRAREYVLRAMDRGVFKNNEDLKAAFTFADNAKGAGDTIKNALGSKTANDILSTIVKRTTALNEFGDPIGGMSNDAMEAQFDFRRMATEWILKNPNASLWETEEQLQKFGKLIFDRMQQNADDIMGEGVQTYDSANPENPYAGRPGGEAAEPQAESEPSEPDPEAPNDAEVDTFIEDLEPDQRTRLERLGSATGRDLKGVVKDLLARNPEAKPIAYNPNEPDPENAQEARESGLTTEQASAFIEEALHGADSGNFSPEEQDGNLLALIKRHESRGNYNAVFGNGGSTRDLSKFTLDGILAQQQRARRSGAASTAIGAYQFIYKTLRSLKSELGLTGKERFTPELQDRLAVQLLKRRGLDQYRAGKISKRQFALRLSQEWASLPDPRTGQSFYAGDGLNRSFTSPSKVYAAMGLPIAAQ